MHQVSFEVANLVFSDPNGLTLFDRVKDSEDRWHATGLANGMFLVLVVHSVRYEGRIEVIEIISDQTPHQS